MILLVIIFTICLAIIILNRNKSKKNKYVPPKELYITLTTSPKRISKMEKVLNILSSQNIKPNKIILNIPYIFKRTKERYTVPEFIEKNPLVKINRVEDVGPATKILGCLNLISNPEAILISVDDDIEYTKNLTKVLYNYSLIYPNAVITGESFVKKNSNNKTDILEGYSGVLYKRKFFNNYINLKEDILNFPMYCYLADDFVLSNYLASNGVPIIVTNEYNNLINSVTLDYGNSVDALHKGANGLSINNLDNYKKCLKYLEKNKKLYIKNINSSVTEHFK